MLEPVVSHLHSLLQTAIPDLAITRSSITSDAAVVEIDHDVSALLRLSLQINIVDNEIHLSLFKIVFYADIPRNRYGSFAHRSIDEKNSEYSLNSHQLCDPRCFPTIEANILEFIGRIDMLASVS